LLCYKSSDSISLLGLINRRGGDILKKQVWIVQCKGNKNKKVQKLIEGRSKRADLIGFIGKIKIVPELKDYVLVEVILGNEKILDLFRGLGDGHLIINENEVARLSEADMKKYGFDD